jgi:hypothetical protein
MPVFGREVSLLKIVVRFVFKREIQAEMAGS